MHDLIIEKTNEAYVRVIGADHILQELSDLFTFFVPGYQFQPKFKNKLWDGRIRLLNTRTGLLYYGLLPKLKKYCDDRNYSILFQDTILSDKQFTIEDAENFIKTLNIPLTVRDYQLASFVHAVNNKRMLLLSPTGCHAKGDKILMYSGVWCNIEDIRIGDIIIGGDGKPKKVLRLYSGIDDMYDVIPRNNRNKITVNKDHILQLKFSDYSSKYGYGKGDKEYIESISVKEYLDKPNWYKHCSNLYWNSEEIIFNTSDEIKCQLSPYFIGAYLGDGSARNCGITNIDSEVIDYISNEAITLGCKVRQYKMSYFFTNNKGRRNTIFNEFDKIGIRFGCIKDSLKCNERFIPKILMTTSIEYRYNLLAGLIDTDGYLENNTNYEFSSKSKELAKNVQELSISLGFVTSIKTRLNKKYNTTYYYVRIMGNISKIPVKIERKKVIENSSIKDRYRSKFNIVYKGKGEYFGFEVEDNLYITNGGIITHNSGKSLIIYIVMRYLQHIGYNKGLLLVPTVSLTYQMFKDFSDYGYDSESNCHIIHQGQDKISNKFLDISTWQSLVKLNTSHFKKFNFIIGDEAHLFKAKSLVSIATSCINADYRIGTTGTLDGTITHRFVLEGLFGPVFKSTTTAKLIDKKQLSNFNIKCLILKYPPEVCREIMKVEYAKEMDYIVRHEGRLKFIKNLALSLKGNSLILFQFVDKHGKPLYNLIKDSVVDRKVFFIHGDVDVAIREEVRAITEKEKDAIIIASYGTFSTGINIKNLHNIISASPYKSKIKILQSIGRVLRLGDDKEMATLFDVADDFRVGGYDNHTLRHFVERIKIYNAEKFDYEFFNVNL